MNQPMQDVVAVDVETSGLSPARGDRVIEYAAVRIRAGKITAELTRLIDVPCNLSPVVIKIHGITRTMLWGQPLPAPAWQDFLNFIGDDTVIAHNAPFDRLFIQSELARLGMTMTNPFQCSLKRAQKVLPRLPNYQLPTVAKHVLGTIPADCEPLHRALGDARLVAKMWVVMEGG